MKLVDLIARRFREHPGLDGANGANGANGAADAAGAGANGAAVHGGPVLPPGLWERALLDPAREFLVRPGKGLRGRLVESGWALAGGGPDGPPPELPALVELLHAGSLIIDDIQDGSEERRGAPALHRTRGTAVALNTGNWMVLLPLHLLGQIDLPEASARAAHERVAATLVSCHQGQALDLLPVGELGHGEIGPVVAMSTLLRTASLTELSAVLGGLAAGADPAVLAALADLGRELGRGLQMLDDLGGLIARERRAKGYEDLRQNRPTWAWAWAAEARSEPEYDQLRAAARQVAAGEDVEPLRKRLAGAVGTIGRERAQAGLRRAWAQLVDRFPASRARDQVAADLEQVEQSYG
ncbi:MAG TPA: polyprenyl synthetase family protein [Kofleriaceae bacterium]|nr:polyprenyl synthetase family protein [Kofleriaceae bacterium]